MFWRRKKEEAVETVSTETSNPSPSGSSRELSVLQNEPVPSAASPATAVDEAPEVAAVESSRDELLCETESARDASQASESAEVSEDQVVAAISTVFDPEIPVNIYELGLIYAVVLKPGAETGPTDVDIKMTLTSPHCPVAETLPGDVAAAARTVPGVGQVDVEVVWDPTWNPDMMSEAAKLELGMF